MPVPHQLPAYLPRSFDPEDLTIEIFITHIQSLRVEKVHGILPTRIGEAPYFEVLGYDPSAADSTVGDN